MGSKIYDRMQWVLEKVNSNNNNISTMDEQNESHGNFNKKIAKSGFAQYSFMYELYKAILVSGLKMPTPVQRKVIPSIMAGKDAIVCYKTGSGKTLSYLLPMINKLKCHSKVVGARALLLIPTRQLAEQITKVMKQYVKFTDLKYTLLLGGHTYEGQFESLTTNPDIIIATPGRLMELVQETDLKLGRVQMIIYDEADMLFENGSFYEQLKEITSKCPISQRLMFSATINETLNTFAKSGLKDYSYIHQQVQLPQTMTIDAYIVRPEDKSSALLFLLEKITLNTKVIIFASTRFHVDFLMALVGTVYDCEGIYGKMDMQMRTNALDNFRRKKGRAILIVTDVAARGIDIPAVQYVIHFDYPTNHKTFVHRSGRTARKEEKGVTISLISQAELPYLVDMATYVGRKLTQTSETKDSINFGSLPAEILDSYNGIIKKLKQKNDEIQKNQDVSIKAFEKFKSCRSEVNQNSMRKAKKMQILTHYKFTEDQDQEQEDFLQRIKNFNPKKSFLELQRIMADRDVENDNFLTAVEKIRTEQRTKKETHDKKQKLKQRNSKKWLELLDKNQLKELEKYKEQKNRERMPIKLVQGVQVEIGSKEKKSFKKDFKNPSQFISATKDYNIKTEFDNLPKIRNNEMEQTYGDQNPQRRQKERVWDKDKKNFVFKKDKDDKEARDDKGKKAYQKWKKTTRLSIPKVGDAENEDNTNLAKQKWLERRKFRHGWKENKVENKGDDVRVNLKNNKTKAIEKKYKKRLIGNAQKSKSSSGSGGRGGGAGRGGKGGAGRGGSKGGSRGASAGGRGGRGGKMGRGKPQRK